MKRTRNLLAAALLGWHLLVSPTAGQAGDSQGRYIAFGLGLDVCAKGAPYGQLRPEAALWLSGFMTSFNVFQPDTYSIMPDDAWHWAGWVAEYCRLNPTANLTAAAWAYVSTMYPLRLTEAPPMQLPSAAPRSKGRPAKALLAKDKNRY